LATFDDGTGEALYAAGQFSSAGGTLTTDVAKWDGSQWSALAGGVSSSSFPVVYAMRVLDDGTGEALYVGGQFQQAGTIAASNIAKWDGTSWSALGSGIAGSSAIVYALEVFDDGNGDALYAAGWFFQAGGQSAPGIARWNGSTWSALDPNEFCSYMALKVFDPGTGPALYAIAHGLPQNQMVRSWNGSAWTTVRARRRCATRPRAGGLRRRLRICAVRRRRVHHELGRRRVPREVRLSLSFAGLVLPAERGDQQRLRRDDRRERPSRYRALRALHDHGEQRRRTARGPRDLRHHWPDASDVVRR
jgi:hypothetical protein